MTKKNLFQNLIVKLRNYLDEDVTDRGMFECMAIGGIIGTIIGILLFGY